MVVYIDLVILSTIVIDYIFLKLISIVWNEKIKIHRLMLGLLLSVMMVLSFIFPLRSLMYFRYYIGLVTIFVVFNNKTCKDYIFKVIAYYMLNIIFIGIIVILNINNVMLLIIPLMLVVILWLIDNYKKYSINEISNIYYVKINNHIYKGYIDTGNSIYYKGLPVVILNNKYNKNLYRKVDNIYIVSLSDTYIDIYEGPPIIIGNVEYIVYFTFSNHIHYDVILHRDCR